MILKLPSKLFYDSMIYSHEYIKLDFISCHLSSLVVVICLHHSLNVNTFSWQRLKPALRLRLWWCCCFPPMFNITTSCSEPTICMFTALQTSMKMTPQARRWKRASSRNSSLGPTRIPVQHKGQVSVSFHCILTCDTSLETEFIYDKYNIHVKEKKQNKRW